MNLNDAFDAAEALDVLAHDYGLYGVKAELDRIGFRAGVLRDRLEALEEQAQDVYRSLEPMALHSDPWDVPTWAAELLSEIGTASEGDAL
jgi:hypothetical protein